MTTWRADRVLVAVDDSPAALRAARVATQLARGTGARVRFVHVLEDGEVARVLAPRPDAGPDGERLGERRSRGADALLRHVVGQASHADLDVDSVGLRGDPAALLLEQVRDWQADLVVIGRSDVRGTGRPYVGTVTRHVLEFSEVPVLVVPRSG